MRPISIERFFRRGAATPRDQDGGVIGKPIDVGARNFVADGPKPMLAPAPLGVQL
jgi:hypothetical protein